jgi:hypothetical protein
MGLQKKVLVWIQMKTFLVITMEERQIVQMPTKQGGI